MARVRDRGLPAYLLDMRFMTVAVLGSALVLSGFQASEPATRSYYLRLEGPGLLGAVPPKVDLDAPTARGAMRARAAVLDAQRQTILPALRALGARVTGDHRRLVNAVRVSAAPELLEDLERLPGVVGSEPVEVLELTVGAAGARIGAPAVWSGVPQATGRAVRIAIVDTGIDYLHADFGGPGDAGSHAANDPRVVEPGTFPTAKVVAGVDLVGDDYVSGGTPEPDPDPLECSGGVPHGTLMASAAAGFGVTSTGATHRGGYAMSFDPARLSIAPGVAPEAELIAVKVSGCAQRTVDRYVDGLEWLLDPNQDGDCSDRPDVVNLSLGAFTGPTPTVGQQAVQTLVRAGVVVVGANGNSLGGRGYFGAGSPAVAPEVISVGSAFNEALVFDMVQAQGPSGETLQVAWQQASSSPLLAGVGVVSGRLLAPAEANGCGGPFPDMSGAVAIILRGGCSFAQKFSNAVAAGADAVIIVDNGYVERATVMTGASRVPAGMVRRIEGEALLDLMARGETTVTIDPDARFPTTFGPDAITGISSRGPNPRDGSLKPDVVAPGDPVTVALPGTGNGGQSQLGGSSIATAFTSGAAALLRQLHPDWTPAEIKVALMNSAAPVADLDGTHYPVTLSGAGRIDVARASQARLLVRDGERPEVASLSYGAITAAEPTTVTRTLQLSNLTTNDAQYDVIADLSSPLDGVQVVVTPAQIDVPANGEASVEVELRIDPVQLPAPAPDGVTNASAGAAGARHFLVEAGGFVRFSEAGAEAARVPFFAPVRAAHRITPRLETTCEGEPLRMAFDGADALPNLPPAIGIFAYVADSGSGDVDAIAVGEIDETYYLVLGSSEIYPTPAMVPNPLLKLSVDTTLDQRTEADYVIDGFDPTTTGSPELRDLLRVKAVVERPYDPQQRYSHTFLNELRPDEAVTFPYFTDVWAIPLHLPTVGIDPAAPEFDLYYHLGTRRNTRGLLQVRPGVFPFDANVDGSPISVGAQVREIRRAPSASEDTKALVVVFTGDRGHRKIVFDIGAYQPPSEGLTVTASAAAEVIDDAVEVQVEVYNREDRAALDVDVVLSDGTAADADKLEREKLGRLEARERRRLSFTVPVPEPGSRTFVVSVEATCVDDEPRAEVTTLRTTVAPGGPLDEGGCACVSPEPRGALHQVLMVGLMGAGWMGRRRRRGRAR